MAIRAIITGATGMVGEGVLDECLKHPSVESVLVIGRRSCGVEHEKLREILRDDFYDFSDLRDELYGFNACYFCLGVSSVGMNEEKYSRITYDLTLALARVFSEVSPEATFCYVSGAGTDETEKGRSMWARVKGRTENAIRELFANGYAYRPGYIQPKKGMKNTLKAYKFFAPLYPLWKALFPKYVCTLEDLGLSMIHVTTNPAQTRIIECKDITRTARLEKEAL